MTTYRDPYIREIVLRNLEKVSGENRYPQVVGCLTALLDDDRELVAAIQDALHGERKGVHMDTRKDDLPAMARRAGAV